MPEDLTLGFFAFGAVLMLISILGGFNVFSVSVSTTISGRLICTMAEYHSEVQRIYDRAANLRLFEQNILK